MKAEVSDQFNLLVRAVDLLQRNLKCVICLELLQNPVKTRCRHSFCQSCINSVLKSASNAQCPLCNTHITRRSIDNDVKSASLVKHYTNIIIAIEKDCGINVESYTIVERDTCEAVFNSPRHKKLSEKKQEDPRFSLIADGDHPLLPISSENKVTVIEKPKGDDKDSKVSCSETPKRTLSLKNVNNTRGNIMNRYSKSYKSKHELNAAPELPVKQLDGVSCKDKVENWLKINSGLLETDFNSPYSNIPELKVNPNFSPVDEDDLLSASQVVETNSYVVPEDTHKLNTMFKSKDQVDSANDPYTFIPSQPTKKSKSKKITKSTASRKGRKICEKIIPTSKGKNDAIGDVTLNKIFCQQIPESQNIADGCNVTINDTFDNLFSDSKCPDKLQKNNIDLVDDVLLFKTPLDPADVENLSDAVSIKSSDDWPISSRKQVMKSAVTRSHRKSLPRKSTLQKKSPRNSRKSEGNKSLKNIDNTIELLQSEFEEVNKYELVTSSQFDREQDQIKNKDKTSSFITKNQLFNKSEKGNLCKLNKSVSDVNDAEKENCTVLNSDTDSKSPGWTRFLEVKKDFRKPTKPSLKALDVSGGSILPSKSTAVFNDEYILEKQAQTSRTAIFNDDVRAMLIRNRSSSEESLDSSGTQGNQNQVSEETVNLHHQSKNLNLHENDICDQETVIFKRRNFVEEISSVLNNTSNGLPVEKNLNDKQQHLNVNLQNTIRNSDESLGPVTHFEVPSNFEIQNCLMNAHSCLDTKVNKNNNQCLPEVNDPETDCIVQNCDVDLKSPGWTCFMGGKKDFSKCTKYSLKPRNVSEGSLLSSKNIALFTDEDISEEQTNTSKTDTPNDEVKTMLVRNIRSSEKSLDLPGTQGKQKQVSEETVNLHHQSKNINIHHENDICDQETVILKRSNFVEDISSVLNKTSNGGPIDKNLNDKHQLLNFHLQNASGNSDESFGPVTHFETPSNLEIQNCIKNALSCLETINLENCNESIHTAVSSLKSELQRKEAMILHENAERDTFIKQLDIEKDNCLTNIVSHNYEAETVPEKVCTSKNSPRTIKSNIKDVNIKENKINNKVDEVVESIFPPPQAIVFPEEFVNVDHTKRLPSVNMQTSDDNSINLTIKFNFNLNDMLRNKNQQCDEISTSCNKTDLSKSRKTFSLLANTEDINELSAIHLSESTQDHISTHVGNTSSLKTHNYKNQTVATQTHQNGIKPHCTADLTFGNMSSAIPVNIDSTIEVSQTDKRLHNIKANFWFSYEDHPEKQTSRNENRESKSLLHLQKPNLSTALKAQKYITEESQEIEKSSPHKLGSLYTIINQNNKNKTTKPSENYSVIRKAIGESVEVMSECTSKFAYNEKEGFPQLLGSNSSNTVNDKEPYSSTNYLPHNPIDINLGESIQEEGKAASNPASTSVNRVQKSANTSQIDEVLLTASSLSNGQGLVFPCGQITADSQISSLNKQSEENSCNENEINLSKRLNTSMSLFSSSNTDEKSGKCIQNNVESSKEIEENKPSYKPLQTINKPDGLNPPISTTSKRQRCTSDDEIRPNKKRNLKNVLCSDSEESSSEQDHQVTCYPIKKLNTPVFPSSQNTEDLLNSEEIIGKVMAKIDEELGLAAPNENYKENRSPLSPKRRKLSQPMFSQPGNADEDEKATLHITINDGDLSSQTRNKLHFTEEKKLLPFHQNLVQEEISVSIPESDDDIIERTPTKVVDATLRDHSSSDKANVVLDNIQTCERNSLKERKPNSNLLQQQEQIKIDYKPSGSKSSINVHNDSVSLLHKNTNNSKLNPAVAKNETQETFMKKPSDLIIMCSGFSRDMPAKIKTAVVALGAVFSEKFVPTATHLIVKTNEQNCTDKTLKYLQAVAAGKWIVNIEWLKSCVRLNKIMPEEQYEVLDSLSGNGPQRSRLSKEPLFKDFVFCCFGPYHSITLEELRDLIFVCGGLVVQSPTELIPRISNYCLIIVGHDNTNSQQLLSKCKHFNIPIISHEWILECISTYDIVSIWPLLIHPSTLEEFQKLHLPAAALEVLDDDETMDEQTFS